jgi:hypothetical protein
VTAAQPYTVVYALERPSSQSVHLTEPWRGDGTPHACYHHVAYVTALHVDEAIDRCRQDALPGIVFRLIVAFHGYSDRRALGDGVIVHDFPEREAR